MSHDKKTATDTREHHKVQVEVRSLTDEEQTDRREQAGRLDPNGGGNG